MGGHHFTWDIIRADKEDCIASRRKYYRRRSFIPTEPSRGAIIGCVGITGKIDNGGRTNVLLMQIA